MLKLYVQEPYLWLPVDRSEPCVKLHFYLEKEKVQEVDIRLGKPCRDFYACMDVSEWKGKELTIEGDAEEELLSGIFCYKEKVQHVYPFRPKLHFSPESGWNNDPNGLVYADGQYHLYYQANPYDTDWGNMHWGHAVSRDLLRWEHKPIALAPDAYGTVFSGCGWEDRENIAGYGKGALLFYYTAAGGSNQWSKEAGNRFTQRLAVSTDGGNTLQRADGVLIGHIAGDNRDPKVFYHEESGAYIMVLYLEGYEFAIFRSTDLLCWEESQRLTGEGMQECPDLFPCAVGENEEEKKWVFWSADGFYMVGSFDGYRFIPETEVLSAYANGLPYAAQTYAGTKGRVISVAWLRMKNDRGNYRGLMAIPAELSLVKKAEGYRLRLQPVQRLREIRRFAGEAETDCAQVRIQMDGTPLEITVSFEPQNTGRTLLGIGKTGVAVDFEREIMEIENPDTAAKKITIPFSGKEGLSLDFIIDQEIIEFYGNDGCFYGAVETEENVLAKAVTAETTAKIAEMKWFELRDDL